MNPSIILGYKQPEIDTPIDSMGKLMKFREAASQEAVRAAQVKHYESLARQAQLKEEQDRREQADEAALQQIQSDPESYGKIMGGDFSVLAGKVSPDRLSHVQKTVSDFHHQQSLREEDDLKAHNAGLGELVNAAQGLKELGDIEQINAQLPNVVDNLSRAGAFKAAQVDPTKVPQRINDVKELDTWLASVGGLMAANNAGLQRKLSEEKIKSEQALQNQRLREKEAAAKVVTGKGGVQYNVKGNVAEPIMTPEGEQLAADVTSKAAVTTPHTVTTEAGIMQFNPETQRFDIPVGKPAKSTATDQGDKLLTPSEAAMLGVPYGTTREAAAGKQPATEAQKVTANYASRLTQANDVIDEIGKQSARMMVEGKLPDLMNFMKSDQTQAFDQAKRNFINSVLRRESGAVISPSEFAEGNRQYFPQSGDSEQVLKQKAENRATVMRNFVKASGNAYEPPVRLKDAAKKMIRARDPQGKLHMAPEGTPLPKGWKLE